MEDGDLEQHEIMIDFMADLKIFKNTKMYHELWDYYQDWAYEIKQENDRNRFECIYDRLRGH